MDGPLLPYDILCLIIHFMGVIYQSNHEVPHITGIMILHGIPYYGIMRLVYTERNQADKSTVHILQLYCYLDSFGHHFKKKKDVLLFLRSRQ